MRSESTRQSLLSRVRDAGNLDAWREFEAKYRDLIIRYCLRRGLQAADCEDVQQLVWLHLSKGLRNFEYDPQRGRFRDYLGRATRSAIARHFSRPNRPAAALDTGVLAVTAADDGQQHDALWEGEWVDHHYRLAMAKIRASFDEKSIAIFEEILRGQSVAKLSQAFSLSTQAVHKVKQRIQRRLRELITQQVRDEEEEGIVPPLPHPHA